MVIAACKLGICNLEGREKRRNEEEHTRDKTGRSQRTIPTETLEVVEYAGWQV
jgi:hypothetical protein